MASALTTGGHAAVTRAAIAAAMALVCAGAMAATGSASLQNFTITAEDLDPNDGVDPGFIFVRAEQSTAVSLRTSGGQQHADQEFLLSWADSAVHLNVDGTTTSASAGPGLMSASTSGLEANARTFRMAVLQVTSHTRLHFTGDAAVSTRIDSSHCGPGAACELSFASFIIWSQAAPGETFALRGGAHNFDAPDTLTGSVDFSYENQFDHLREFTLQMDATVFSSVGPVPEPQSYALMLAGLALCAWVARRRAQ
jgi:hypothetical protein